MAENVTLNSVVFDMTVVSIRLQEVGEFLHHVDVGSLSLLVASPSCLRALAIRQTKDIIPVLKPVDLVSQLINQSLLGVANRLEPIPFFRAVRQPLFNPTASVPLPRWSTEFLHLLFRRHMQLDPLDQVRVAIAP